MKTFLWLCVVGVGLTACAEKPAEKKGAPPALITVMEVKSGELDISERTLGTLEALQDPKIAAEVAGKVTYIAVRAGEQVKKGQLLAQLDASDLRHQASADQAETARLQALLAQQERVVARQSELVLKNFMSRNALDEVTAQRDALKSQLQAATDKAAISRHNTDKTRLLAPFAGTIEELMVSAGDYVKVGDPLLRLISNQQLRAHLPFPESAGLRIRIGMPVRLSSPLAPDQPVTGMVEDIRPGINESNRALDVIARLDNPGFLKGGGSVNAAVITSRQSGAILVPEHAVVLRPAGKVVYLIEEGKAVQRIVETGSKQQGQVEIRSGLQGGERVALDGAGFLSHNAAVAVKDSAPKPAAAEKPAKSAQ